MLNHQINKGFRERLDRGGAMLLPGAVNALAARIAEDEGFEALYLSGAGLTNTEYGMPDNAFVSLPDLARTTAAIRNVTDLPIVVDADTGFGNALNVQHTIRTLENAGASAIQLEDQVMPKRCGHFSGKEIVGFEQARMRIRAAVDARRDPNTLIVARTDAAAVDGMEAALERSEAFAEEGADILFLEAPERREDIAAMAARLKDRPLLINLVIGGRTPIIPLAELDQMGFSLVLYANIALQGAMHGMQSALRSLRAEGRMDETGPVAPFAERQRLVAKSTYDEIANKYGGW